MNAGAIISLVGLILTVIIGSATVWAQIQVLRNSFDDFKKNLGDQIKANTDEIRLLESRIRDLETKK